MKYIPYGHQCVDLEDIKAVVRVLKSDWLTQGPKIKEFEQALCKYTGVKYAVAVSSGTAALHIGALAAGIKKGDEVVTSPITFVATANCVLYCGAKPVFADVQKDTVNIDPGEIKKKITSRTKAIIPVHFAGQPCDLREIRSIARKYGLLVIEDAAHALGAEYMGKKIGSCLYSDMAILSFHPVKSITTGEGGAVLTNNKALYEKLAALRTHGITREELRYPSQPPNTAGAWYYEQQELGFNYRITDIQCALGLSQLKKLDRFIGQRRAIASVYTKLLEKVPGLVLPAEQDHVKSAWHLYPVRIDAGADTLAIRKKIFDGLRAKGVGAQVHYIPVYWQPYYRDLGFAAGLCPNAEGYYAAAVSLPIYPDLTEAQVRYVVGALKNSLREQE